MAAPSLDHYLDRLFAETERGTITWEYLGPGLARTTYGPGFRVTVSGTCPTVDRIHAVTISAPDGSIIDSAVISCGLRHHEFLSSLMGRLDDAARGANTGLADALAALAPNRA